MELEVIGCLMDTLKSTGGYMNKQLYRWTHVLARDMKLVRTVLAIVNGEEAAERSYSHSKAPNEAFDVLTVEHCRPYKLELRGVFTEGKFIDSQQEPSKGRVPANCNITFRYGICYHSGHMELDSTCENAQKVDEEGKAGNELSEDSRVRV
ncbi:hypothetical protein V6N12_063728 [Hibiscus sabdariffa]|uniref:Uncharacterized protein n=1 Tax=Hibiscus sabdariffa TaxID=183260 RepID=A0ABR2FCN2_9ROSI